MYEIDLTRFPSSDESDQSQVTAWGWSKIQELQEESQARMMAAAGRGDLDALGAAWDDARVFDTAGTQAGAMIILSPFGRRSFKL